MKIPAGTRLASHGFYLLGLANSGLVIPRTPATPPSTSAAQPAWRPATRSPSTPAPNAETRKIVSVGTAAGNWTTLWQPLPDGPIITIPAGSSNVPVTAVSGIGPAVALAGTPFNRAPDFAVGDKIAIGYGGSYPSVAGTTERYEVVTVTAVGKQGTQAYLGADALAGSTNIKVTSVANISVGDKIRLDIDSVGHGIETVTVTKVGTQSSRGAQTPGTGLDLAAPLRFNHAANLPFSDRGTGISFQPATAFAHLSNEPVQALGTGIALDRPLVREHAINAVVRDANSHDRGLPGNHRPQPVVRRPRPRSRRRQHGTARRGWPGRRQP